MKLIKPIDTMFRGNRCRSRLEARWLVFLAALDLDYAYEPIGMELPSGWYLPDVYVNSWDAFLEIKPIKATDAELLKGKELSIATNSPVMIIQGQPWPDEYSVIMFTDGELSRGRIPQMPCEFGECPDCEGAMLLDIDSGVIIRRPLQHSCGGCDEIAIPGRFSKKLMDAFTAARSARFEHVETGL